MIDTDWLIDYLKGKATAGQLLDQLVREGIAISLITYGEILEGIYYGREPKRQEQIFRAFLQATPILPLMESSMERFAHIRGGLRAQGQLIGDADILIAAIALDHDLTLVTQNVSHFRRIPNLTLYQQK
ncbi:MAG: type II toxin-antitoxin system VapC family toxin [Caldilineaceae bacterium]|nr:type II toxin-antitoxin system VapC family toxin [Caldilineaceae bacterium]